MASHSSAGFHSDHFIYLQDGPRAGDSLLAAGHTGKVCIAPVANGAPRLGSELVYEPTNIRTADGARVYRLYVPPWMPEPVPLRAAAPVAGDDEMVSF